MMASALLINDAFLKNVETVRSEIGSKFARAHLVLREREGKLLSDLKDLEERYRGAELTEQIEELNELKRVQLATVKLNKNKELVMQHVSEVDAKIASISETLERERASIGRIALEWDGELETRLSGLGSITSSPVPIYKMKRNPVKVACKNKDEYSKLPGVFCYPRSVAIDSETNSIYICDGGNNRVQVFKQSYEFLFDFNEKMFAPDGVCICNSKVYVTQFSGHSLNMYTVDGKLSKLIGKRGKRELEFHYPWGVAVSRERNMIYVCDSNNDRIQCLNVDLTFNSFVPDIPSPRDIKLTCDEMVVLTGGDHCIRYYNYSHQMIRKMIPRGKGNCAIDPLHFCLDTAYNILMTDSSANCVLIFTKNGQLLHKFGKRGGGRGNFIGPKGIALDSENRIIVVSINREHCIQLF